MPSSPEASGKAAAAPPSASPFGDDVADTPLDAGLFSSGLGLPASFGGGGAAGVPGAGAGGANGSFSTPGSTHSIASPSRDAPSGLGADAAGITGSAVGTGVSGAAASAGGAPPGGGAPQAPLVPDPIAAALRPTLRTPSSNPFDEPESSSLPSSLPQPSPGAAQSLPSPGPAVPAPRTGYPSVAATPPSPLGPGAAVSGAGYHPGVSQPLSPGSGAAAPGAPSASPVVVQSSFPSASVGGVGYGAGSPAPPSARSEPSSLHASVASLYPSVQPPPPPPPSGPPLPPEAPTRARLESVLSSYLSRSELDKLEEHADLYAILKTTEKLERAYVRDAVSAAEYGPECAKLIAQFRTLWEAARGNVGGVHGFAAKHRLAIPYATKRLLGSGVPATVEYGDSHFGREGVEASAASGGLAGGPGAGGPEPQATGAAIAETVQYFITSMDSLKLNMTAIDQVYPILTSLQAAVAKVPGIARNSSGRASIAKWVDKLHDMPAHYTLSDEESRQLLFEIDAAYSEFMRMLQT